MRNASSIRLVILRAFVLSVACGPIASAQDKPPSTIGTIERSAQLSGAAFPDRLRSRFEAVADDPAAVRAIGIEQASELCQRLLDEGAPGIHFITMNRSTATREIWFNVQARVSV